MPRRSSKPPTESAYHAGLRLLARRAHSRQELRSKLGRRGYDEADVKAAVAQLIGLGYLDDQSFAAGHVRRRSGTRGPIALSAELAARGVDRAVTAEALAGIGPEAQLVSAERLARRLAGSRPFSGYRELLDRVGAKLVRRGFSPAVARMACNQVWNGTADTLGPQVPQPRV